MVLEVLWHRLTLVKHLLNASVSNIASNNKCTLKVKAGLDRILCKDFANLIHTLVKVNIYCWRHCWSLLWKEASWILLKLLNEDTLWGNLSLDITVCRAANADSYWARGCVTRCADNANVVNKVLTTELCTDTHILANLEDLLLPLQVTEATTALVTRCWELVKITCRCLLNSCKTHLSRCTTDTNCEVIWRTSRCTKILDVLLEELHE